MTVITRKIQIATRGNDHIVDITGTVRRFVAESGLKDGIATIFVPGATGGVSTIEYEPGLLKDFPRALERIAPPGVTYEHGKRWGDDNGKSHVKATLIGPSLVVPFSKAAPILGTWQQIVVMDFDTKARKRDVVIQVMGE